MFDQVLIISWPHVVIFVNTPSVYKNYQQSARPYRKDTEPCMFGVTEALLLGTLQLWPSCCMRLGKISFIYNGANWRNITAFDTYGPTPKRSGPTLFWRVGMIFLTYSYRLKGILLLFQEKLSGTTKMCFFGRLVYCQSNRDQYWSPIIPHEKFTKNAGAQP